MDSVRRLIHLTTKSWLQVLAVMALAVVALAPQLRGGISCGHDFDFHLVSWMDARAAWSEGALYPHWAPSPNFGAGEPRFVFYPPLTWMLGAALGSLLPWSAVPFVMLWILLAGTGLGVRALARELLPARAATLAGAVAIFSGYVLFTAYERSAFGELAGGALVPLVLLFLLRESSSGKALLWRRVLDSSLLWLTLSFAACWLVNLPLGVMAGYLMMAVAALLALLRREWTPLLRATLAALLGLMLVSFYLLPAVEAQRWVDVAGAIDDPGLRVENSWLLAHHSSPLLAEHDAELHKVSLVGLAMLAVTLLAVLLFTLRRRTLAEGIHPHRHRWLALGMIPLAVLAMQLPLSLALWQVLPKLRFLQFPWRLLLMVEAPMALLVAAAIWGLRRWGRRWALLAVAVGCAASLWIASRSYYQACYPEDTVAGVLASYQARAGFEGFDEYAPPGADNTLVATGLPDGCLSPQADETLGVVDVADANPDWWTEQKSCAAELHWTSGTTEHRRMRFSASSPTSLILRLRRYPAWKIAVNGKPATESAHREDGLVAIAIPAGPVEVSVDWQPSRAEWAGRGISLLALAVLLGLWLAEKRRGTVAVR